MNGWSSTGGGGIAIFVLTALILIAFVWLIAEVIAPIICYLAPWCQ